MKKQRSSWIIEANIRRIQNQIEQGKCKNPYAANNLIKKLQRELADSMANERSEGIENFLSK
jgi:hypothetical protein